MWQFINLVASVPEKEQVFCYLHGGMMNIVTEEDRKLRGDGVSTMIPDSLFDADLSPTEFRLWCYYSMMGSSDMTVGEASKGSGISVGAVSSARQSLHKKGWIEKPKTTNPIGYVYLINAEGQNAYKVGLTGQDPRARLSDLSTGMPFEPILLGAIKTDNMFALEKRFHKHYKSRVLWIRGEWFRLTCDDIHFFFSEKQRIESN